MSTQKPDNPASVKGIPKSRRRTYSVLMTLPDYSKSDSPAVKLSREHPTRKSIFQEEEVNGPTNPKVHVAIMPQVLLVNAGPAGVLPVHKGYVLEETIHHREAFNKIATEGTFLNGIHKQVTRTRDHVVKNGQFVSLVGMWCLGFYHWMMEYSFQAVVALQAGFKGTFIIPNQRVAWETLQLLGIPPERIAPYDGRIWKIESLFMVKPIPAMSELSRYPALLHNARKRFIHAIGTKRSPAARLYVTRPPTSTAARRVVNEPDLLRLLERFNFQTVAFERLPLREQIRAVAGARCLVGPHGAGMLHCLFMPPESLVMEFFSPVYINPCLLPIIEHLRHRYFMIPCVKNWNYQYGEDIEANLQAIRVALQRELSST